MKRVNLFVKKSLISFYRTKLGQKFWRYGVRQLQRPFFYQAIRKALAQSRDLSDIGIEPAFPIGRLSLDQQSKHALVIFPFLGANATSNNIKDQCEKLREVGFVVHGIIFSDHPEKCQDNCFDTFHVVNCRNENFGNWNVNKEANLFERNKIDDWMSDDLLNFVRYLDQYYSFELSICHYNFLSLALTALSKKAYKVIYTHDVFVRRNEKLLNIGLNEKDFYFSCSRGEERKGLKRADLVLAIQDKEANYIKNYLGITKVLTLPFIPKKKYKKEPSLAGEKAHQRVSPKKDDNIFVLGYFGGTHGPNVLAFNRFLKALGYQKNIKILIGGGISSFYTSDPKSNIEVLGFVHNVNDFYERCDLCVNPDTLESGMKIKTIEAMIYGVPVVCTKVASLGLNSKEPLHLLENENNVADSVIKLVRKGRAELEKLKLAGDTVISNLERNYSAYAIFSGIYVEILKKAIPKIQRSEFAVPKVSVILPCYKVEKYLPQALASVCSQTLKEIEILAVDNGSPDNCGQIIKQFTKFDERIVPISIPVNKGYGGAINEGLKRAQGEYISIVEPDDWIAPEMLKTLYDSSNDGKENIVKAGFFKHFIGQETVEKNYFFDFKNSPGYQDILVKTDRPEIVLGESSIWSAIYKKSFLEQNCIKMAETPGASYQDLIWKFSTYSSAEHIRLVSKSFYHYRIQTQNSSSKSDNQPLIVFSNFERIRQELQQRRKWQEWRELCVAHLYLDLVFHEERLSSRTLPAFYEKGKMLLKEMDEIGMGIDNIHFPASVEPYVFNKVLPVIRRIKKFTKTEEVSC